MSFIPSRLKRVMRTASIATVATTMISGFLGKKSSEKSASPLDALGNMLRGDAGHDDKDAAAGAAASAGAMYAWAAVLEGVFGKWVRRADGFGPSIGRAAFAGTAVSALAFVADSYVLPKQVTPEHDKRLSPVELATTYGILAASLAAGAVWANRGGETA